MASTALLGGSAAPAIAVYGEASDVDLIVVGCQGHRAVTGAFLGRVSLGLLRDSTRRVLIVRGSKRSRATTDERSSPSRGEADNASSSAEA